jgi:O-antigen/teichoic acid export membrane protein
MLYGAADVLVLLVGGFLLLPLYTRTLSQAEFGQFVVIRAGIELLTYLLHFGLLSAVARLYFDHSDGASRRDYMSSVVMLFLLLLAGWSVLLAGFGERAWEVIAPGAPAQPYLWASSAIAVTAFFGTLTTTWLRLDGRAGTFVMLQVVAAAALAAFAFVNLLVFDLGLNGLLLSLLAGPLITAMLLPSLFERSFRPRLRAADARATLNYSVPAVAALVAYFVLNRISIVILQRHAPLDEIAVFGLAQQLALLIGLTGIAFGKAMQPAVFGAGPDAAAELLRRFGQMLTLALAAVTSLLMLFAAEVLAVVAPASYRAGHDLLLILAVATFAYALGLLADTAVLHQRRPRLSAGLSSFGAVLATLLALLLIPRLGTLGAALAMAGAFVAMLVIGQVVAARLTGLSFLRLSMQMLGLVVVVAVFAGWLHRAVPVLTVAVVLTKILVAAMLLALFHRMYIKGDPSQMRES